MRLPKIAFRALVIVAMLMLFTAGGVFAEGGVHWSYTGDTGPDHWGELSPDFATCGKGVEQSPINIASNAPTNSSGIQFHYQPSALTILNNGHTIQANYDKGSSIVVDGETYELIQFHFHATSEHEIDGQHSPLEIHFVHKSAKGGLAVVGVMLQSGAENAAYASVFQHLPATESDPAKIDGAMVDASSMIPTQSTYWRYNGSLTTPPCSEGVKWLVMTTPVTLSDAQIAEFTKIYAANARPVQPINSRTFLIPTTLPVTGDGVLIIDPLLLGVGILCLGSGATLAVIARRRAT